MVEPTIEIRQSTVIVIRRSAVTPRDENDADTSTTKKKSKKKKKDKKKKKSKKKKAKSYKSKKKKLSKSKRAGVVPHGARDLDPTTQHDGLPDRGAR